MKREGVKEHHFKVYFPMEFSAWLLLFLRYTADVVIK